MPKTNHGRRRMALTRYEVNEMETCPECSERLTRGSCYYRREVINMLLPLELNVEERQVRKGGGLALPQLAAGSGELERCRVGKRTRQGAAHGPGGLDSARLRVTPRTIQEFVDTDYQVHLRVGEIGNLCRRTMGDLTQAGAGLLAKARASRVVQMDATGWREDRQNGYVLCLVTDTPQPVRCYEFHHSRSGEFGRHSATDF